jgi:hypothetical protein
MFVDLETVKKHLQIDADYTGDDNYLLMLISVAEQAVATHLDLNLTEYTDISTKVTTQSNTSSPQLEAIVIAGKVSLRQINPAMIVNEDTEVDEPQDTPDDTIELPAPIKQAILLMIGNLYANREPVTYGTVIKVPYTLDYLLGLYKNYQTC